MLVQMEETAENSAVSSTNKEEVLMLKVHQVLIDSNGKNVLRDSFEKIEIFDDYIKVRNEGKYGIYSMKDYRQILTCKWDRITISNGYMLAFISNKIMIFNSNGDNIISGMWDKVAVYDSGIWLQKESKQGFYSHDGRAIIECNWKRVEIYPKVLVAYKGNGEKRRLFDYSGKEIATNEN